jgi:hypothetical protein
MCFAMAGKSILAVSLYRILPASQLPRIDPQLLRHQYIRHPFFTCSSYRLTLKLGAVSFSSGHATPPSALSR